MKKIILYLLFVCTIQSYAATGPLLYGMTQGGGAYSKGNIFKVFANGTSFTTMYSFNTSTGYAPLGSLIQSYSNSKLYGLAQLGGANNAGVIFSFEPSTNIYTDLIDFNTTNGSTPVGNIIQASNGLIYGMTQLGGISGDGVLFCLDPANNNYTVLINFSGTNGSFPNGSLIQATNGLLYGMTLQGGATNLGTIFSYNISTNILSTVINFTGNNGASPGSNPHGSLVQLTDSTIYGLTRLGGNNNGGVLFGLNPINNAYTNLYSFGTFGNHYPNGSLCKGPGDTLYGMTTGGGALAGSLFKYDVANNGLSTPVFFSNNEHPKGSFFLSGNGLMYFMTDSGGATNNGKIMVYDPVNQTANVVHLFDGITGSNPLGDITIARCPNVNFHTDTSTFCKPLSVDFTNQTTYADSFFWKFGDGITDTAANPSHIYVPGIDTVYLFAWNHEGCEDTAMRIYHFVANPTRASFTDTMPHTGCPTLTMYFTNTSQFATSYYWSFGDGAHSSAISPGHNYNVAAYYDIYLVALDSINHCDDTLVMQNYIHVLAAAPVSSNFTMDINSGCTPLTINFANTSSSNTDSLTWYFGDMDSSNIANPSHTFINGNTFYPRLIAYNIDSNYPCIGKSTKVDTIFVHASAHANFLADSLHGCLPMNDQFTNNSTNALSYHWNFGDGYTDTATNPVHQYTIPGTFTDTLIAFGTAGCNDTFIRPNYIATQVRPDIIPAFSGTPLSGCDSLQVQFNNTSTDASFYLWKFGDGGTASIRNPDYFYTNPGTYSVILIAYNMTLCGLLSDTLILFNYVHVLPPPTIIITQSNDTLTSNFATGNQWYNNGIIIPGATAQTYVVHGTGCYQTTYTDGNGCSNISNSICIYFAGINEPSTTKGMNFYPNPFSEKTTLVLNEPFDTENTSFSIFNVMGQEVQRINIPNIKQGKTEVIINRNNLPAGLYFYKLMRNNTEQIYTGKLSIVD